MKEWPSHKDRACDGPRTGMKVVYHVSTSHNQNSFIPQRRKFSADFEMEGSGLGLINAQLHNRMSALGQAWRKTDQAP